MKIVVENDKVPGANVPLNDVIKKSTYMDDIISGKSTTKEAISLYKALKKLFAQGGLNLHKFLSNSIDIMNAIPKADKAKGEEAYSIGSSSKTLGVEWFHVSDTIGFEAAVKNTKMKLPKKITKRTVVKCSLALFDPIGLLQPFTVRTKILMRELWAQGLQWDDLIESCELTKAWHEWIDDLDVLETLKVRRPYAEKPIVKCELFAFGDASKECYATAVYIKSLMLDGSVDVSLASAKSRVVPLKQELTIPKKELLAALIAARLVTYVQNELSDFDAIIGGCFTDSSIVLSWIRGSNDDKLNRFVMNRLKEIRQKTPANLWHHVKTEENPADLNSRGVSAKLLVSSGLWWNGPPWLRTSSSSPHENVDENVCRHEHVEEYDPLTTENRCLIIQDDSERKFPIDVKRFGTATRAINVMGHGIRPKIYEKFVSNLEKSSS